METRYVVAYVVTDVKRNECEIVDYDYDVTVDVVKRWKLTNLPVRWQHLMPERSEHGCGILSNHGIGKVKNWWLDFSPRWDPFAVAVVLEINDPDVLSSPTLDQYRCVSLTYLAHDHTQCVEISLVRTGQRRLTAGKYVPRQMLDKVCSEAFGFPKDQYKRRRRIASSKTVVMASDEAGSEAPAVLQGDEDGRAANASKLDEGKGNTDAVNRLLEEAETIQAILEKIPSKEGECLLKLIEDRNKRVDDVEQKVNRRLETWSVQLRDLLNRFSQSIDGRCDAENEKRQDDFDQLNRQLDSINDVWKRMELITASFETVSRTISSNKPSRNDTRKTLFESVRKKWPGDVKVTVRESDEIEDVVDRFSEAIRKGEALETKRRNGTLDRYLNIVKGQLKQAASMSDSEGLSHDEIQWIRGLKRKNQQEKRTANDGGGSSGKGEDVTMDTSKKVKKDDATTVEAGFRSDREPKMMIPTHLPSTSSSTIDTKEPLFNYWKDRK